MTSSIFRRSGMRALVVSAALTLAGPARADGIDNLVKSLSSDSSFKVRVQAALVLGKVKDQRAVTALIAALKDGNATVRATAATSLGQIGDQSANDALLAASNDSDPAVHAQALKALSMLTGGASPSPGAPTNKNARFYLAIGFAGSAPGNQLVREALAHELQKLPDVQLSSGGADLSGAAIAQRKLQGYMVDGTVQRLSVALSGGQVQIDCDLKAFVATYPAKSIKMMTTEGASLQAGASERESGKRDCIQAAAESIRDDVAKYLKTLQ